MSVGIGQVLSGRINFAAYIYYYMYFIIKQLALSAFHKRSKFSNIKPYNNIIPIIHTPP